MLEKGFAINRGNQEKPISSVDPGKLRTHSYIRGFIVYLEAGEGEVLIEWVADGWTYQPQEVINALEKAAEVAGIAFNPRPELIVRTAVVCFVDWIGSPPAMSFEFGRDAHVYATCAGKLSMENIRRNEFGHWLFFVQCYQRFLKDGTPFWMDDNVRQPMDPIPDWVLEAVGGLDGKKGDAPTPPRRPLLSRLGAWRNVKITVVHKPQLTMGGFFLLSDCEFLWGRDKRYTELRAWIDCNSRRSVTLTRDGRIQYLDLIGHVPWLVTVEAKVDSIEGHPEFFPEIEFGENPEITITIYGEPEDPDDVESARLF